MNQRTTILLAAIGVAVLALASWIFFFANPSKSPFETLAATYQQLTVPVDAKSDEVSEIAMGRFSADVRWEFETEMSWEKYRGWIKKQMEGTFRLAKDQDGELIFRRSETGDMYTLKVKRLKEEGNRLNIRITFAGIAS